MVTRLHSDKLNIEINCYYEIGNIRNKLPLGREFLIVELLGGNIKIENAWDLLKTYSVQEVKSVVCNPNDYVFTKFYEVRLALFNERRCIVLNTKVEKYAFCIIWDTDEECVDFICKYVDEYGVTEILTSGPLVSRYQIDVLNL